jgi:hypothetical protein
MTRRTDCPAPAKRPYHAPTLKVLGNFRKLTGAKGGTSNDGSGKPSTKLSGPGA